MSVKVKSEFASQSFVEDIEVYAIALDRYTSVKSTIEVAYAPDLKTIQV